MGMRVGVAQSLGAGQASLKNLTKKGLKRTGQGLKKEGFDVIFDVFNLNL